MTWIPNITRLQICLFGAIFVLSNCSAPPKNRNLNCPEITNLDNLSDKKTPQILIFGELHGTNESPQFIGDVICHFVNEYIPVILALEYSDENFTEITKFLNNDSSSADSELLQTSYWIGGGQDGKRSRAMFDLLVRSKKIMRMDNNYKVIGFDMNSDDFKKMKGSSRREIEVIREKSMAKNIISYSEENPNHKIIVLTGNYHSRRSQQSDVDKHKKMVDYFPLTDYISFEMSAQDGSIWTWLGSETPDRGNVAPAFFQNGIPSNQRSIFVDESRNMNGHDGMYYTVTKTTSRPTSE